MSRHQSLRQEIEELRAEIEALRSRQAAPADAPPAEAVDEGPIAELNRLVRTMLDDAEETVADHPVATVAGALALGIVIGRLSVR